MQITIKTTSPEVTGDVQTLIENKFAAMTRLVPETALLSCEIERSVAVERAGAKYRAEGNLSVDGKLYRAECDGTTLEEAVDGVRDGLEREYKRAQGRRRELVRRGGAALKRMLRLG